MIKHRITNSCTNINANINATVPAIGRRRGTAGTIAASILSA
jgi:hypothetical protein